MINRFDKKNLSARAVFAPMDFHRFKHHQELAVSLDDKTKVSLPLWIVGLSPFDRVTSMEEGYIVHLGMPRFTARWTMRNETISQIKTPNFYDEDTNILIYEVVPMDGNKERIQDWLVEAACAVGYWKGLIAASAPEESH